MKHQATVTLTHAQYVMLCSRYKKRKDISPDKLVKLAVLETVAEQAKKELKENGYAYAEPTKNSSQ